MSDRFEDAVRQAALDLGATTELPTYHDAWRRGRRRRFVKRSALAAAGAMVFVAALTVNLGRLPGSEPTDSDDVAVAVSAATPTALATTAPVDAPTVGPEASPEIASIPSTAAAVDPTAEPTPSRSSTPTPAPARETVPPAATAEPTPVPPAVLPPTPQPTVAAVEPTTPPQTFALPEATEVPDTAGATSIPPEPTNPPDTSADEPAVIAATQIAERPDAVVIDEQGTARGRGCDSDLDGVVDAMCELLADYFCSGDGDVAAGYEAFDDDGDGIVETCRAVGLTMCDTTGDGFGDTPCIIGLDPNDDEGSAVPLVGE